MPDYDTAAALKLLSHGKSTEAITVSKRLVSRMPASVTPLVILARALESQEQFRPAFDAWCRAAALMPTSPLIRKGVRRTASKMAGPIGLGFAEFTGEDNLLSAKAFTLTGAPPPPEESVADVARFRGPLVADPPVAKAPPVAEAPPGVEAAPVAPRRAPEAPAAAAPPATPAPAAPAQSPASAVAAPAGRVSTPRIEELDTLIANLEGARIEPRPDAEAIEPAELGFDGGDMVSETLARIFTGQKQYVEAARVYEKLAERDPDRAKEFQLLAGELRDRAKD